MEEKWNRKKWILLIAALSVILSVGFIRESTMVSSAAEQEDGAELSGDGTWKKTNKKYSKYTDSKGNTYVITSNGQLKKNGKNISLKNWNKTTKKLGSTRFYVKKKKIVRKQGWQTGKDSKYYVGKDGAVVTSCWKKINNVTYYFGKTGKAVYKLNKTTLYKWNKTTKKWNKAVFSGKKGTVKKLNGKCFFIKKKTGCVQTKEGWYEGSDGCRYYVGTARTVKYKQKNKKLYQWNSNTNKFDKKVRTSGTYGRKYFTIDSKGNAEETTPNTVVNDNGTLKFIGTDGKADTSKGKKTASDGTVYYVDGNGNVVSKKAADGIISVYDTASQKWKKAENTSVLYAGSYYYAGSDSKFDKTTGWKNLDQYLDSGDDSAQLSSKTSAYYVDEKVVTYEYDGTKLMKVTKAKKETITASTTVGDYVFTIKDKKVTNVAAHVHRWKTDYTSYKDAACTKEGMNETAAEKETKKVYTLVATGKTEYGLRYFCGYENTHKIYMPFETFKDLCDHQDSYVALGDYSHGGWFSDYVPVSYTDAKYEWLDEIVITADAYDTWYYKYTCIDCGETMTGYVKGTYEGEKTMGASFKDATITFTKAGKLVYTDRSNNIIDCTAIDVGVNEIQSKIVYKTTMFD